MIDKLCDPRTATVVRAPLARWDFFISYRTTETGKYGDKSAFSLRKILRERGFSAFVYEAEICPGDDWPQIINQAIETCRVFVVLCSPTYGTSEWAKEELPLAVACKRLVIPVWHSGSYPPPGSTTYLRDTIPYPRFFIPDPRGTFNQGYVAARISHESVVDELTAVFAQAGVESSS